MNGNDTARVHVMIDDRLVEVPAGATVYEAAALVSDEAREANPVPILCHREHLPPVAVCRVCVVDIDPDEKRKLVPACITPVRDKMQIRTAKTSQRVRTCVQVLTEMLATDHLAASQAKSSGNDELQALARQLQIVEPRFRPNGQPRGQDDSSMVIDVDHDACILCDRCVRACAAVDNNVIGRMGKGYTTRIAFDLNDPMGNSSCVACGECMVACPTGALTARHTVGRELVGSASPDVVKLTADDLVEMEMFQGVSKAFLRWNEGTVVRRRVRQGEIICREGEAGSTAFYIEEGEVTVSLESVVARRVRTPGGTSTGAWSPGRLLGRLLGTSTPPERPSGKRYIHVDAPVSLEYQRPIATMGAGQLFGEQSCLNMYPRSATVRAATDCVLLEMSRKVLYIMQRNKLFRDKLDTMYRQRALRNHLRGASIFSDLTDDPQAQDAILDELQSKARLLRFEPGEVIFRQGDPADAFYFVRTGFVRISQSRAGGEVDRTYIGQGEAFGEIALLSNSQPEIARLEKEVYGASGRRTATCTALDHVELVRFDKDDFLEIVQRFPRFQQRLVDKAKAHLASDRPKPREIEEPPLREFLEQGLFQAQSLLVLDLEKCTRCDECAKACADVHDGVTRLVREGLRFDRYLVASSCRTCHDPYCTRYCPVDAIHPASSRHRAGGREMVIEDHCIGCGLCAENCPYGNINMTPIDALLGGNGAKHEQVAVVQRRATTCDLCRDTRDGRPSCVYACPHDAAHRWDGSEFWRHLAEEER